jgi:hypothetical protein
MLFKETIAAYVNSVLELLHRLAMSPTFRCRLLLSDRNAIGGCVSVYMHVSKTHGVEGESY